MHEKLSNPATLLGFTILLAISAVTANADEKTEKQASVNAATEAATSESKAAPESKATNPSPQSQKAEVAEQDEYLIEEPTIQTDYVHEGILSDDQQKIVIELAKQRGIDKIARISTYYLRPSAARGIAVQGAEQVEGRAVAYQILHVRYKPWWHPNAGPAESDLQIDDFWAGQPSTRKQTILKVGEKEYRTGTIQGMSIEECESVLARLMAGKYKLGPNVDADRVTGINWSRPLGFRKVEGGDQTSVSFDSGDGGFMSLELVQTKDEITINELMQAIP